MSAPDLEAFRAEVRDWIAEHCPASVRNPLLGEEARYQGGPNFPFTNDEHRQWFEACRDRGWTAPDWAKEYGGGGYSPAEAAVIWDEMRRVDAIRPLNGTGLSMAGPAILQFGSEEVKRRFLPMIASGETCWCQGFSEPDAGSDLAGLKTRAVSDGDDYIINGSKIWTTFAHRSDWMFGLVRTDPSVKQRGITFLLIDMRTPGIEVRPIRMINGHSVFNEVFFTDVRVPKANVVGAENHGWSVAKYLMERERDTVAEFGFSGDLELEGYARKSGLWQEGRITDPQLRLELAEAEVDSWALDCSLRRFAEEKEAGRESGAYSSVLKYCGSRIYAARAEMVVTLLGAEGLEWRSVHDGDDKDTAAMAWLLAKAVPILGGTSEIQLNIISRAILNLPS